MRAIWFVVMASGVAGCGASPEAPDAPLPDAAPVIVPSPLIPLGPQNEWTYQSTRTRGTHSETCTMMQSVSGSTMVDGRDVGILTKSQMCSKGTSSATYYVAQPDDSDSFEVRQDTDTAWKKYAPTKDGFTWNAAETGEVEEVTWHQLETVTVMAGTFGDCWAAVATDGTETHTYCRKIGEVSTDTSEANGTMTHVELMAKSF